MSTRYTRPAMLDDPDWSLMLEPLFWPLQDRSGNSVYILRDVYGQLFDRFDASDSVGDALVWPHVQAHGISLDHAKRAITAALDRRGKRWRFSVEPIQGLDAYLITKLKGLRCPPVEDRQLLKALRERTEAATSVEDAADVLREREKLERRLKGDRPLTYRRRGSRKSPTSKYGWESLPHGELRVFDASPERLRGSFKSWCEARGIRGASLETVRLKDGQTAARRLPDRPDYVEMHRVGGRPAP